MDPVVPDSFIPLGQGMAWQNALVVLHAGSDLLIAAAFFSIPFALVYFARKRPDRRYRSVLDMFAAFLLACGLTHVLNAWNIWFPDYWTSGVFKFVTAAVSITVAVILWRLMPEAVAWPSPAQLHQINEELRREMQRRQEVIMTLRESETQLRGAFDQAPIGKALLSLRGHWLKVNAALCGILGYSEAELLATDFPGISHPDDRDLAVGALQELIGGQVNRHEAEQRCLHRLGHNVWVQMAITLVYDADHRPDYFIVHVQDITTRKHAEVELRQAHAVLEQRVVERTRELAEVNLRLAETNQRLERLASTDVLSGLYNRRYLMEMLDKSLNAAQRHHIRLSLMLIDIDNFKPINDQHGHQAGDQAIIGIGQAIRANLRDIDVAARIGGDEFCVLAPYAGLDESGHIAEKLRRAIGALRINGADGDKVTLTCSIGMAEWQPDIETVDQLLELADRALYAAKRGGRNQVSRVSS